MFDWLPWRRAKKKAEFIRKLRAPHHGKRTVRFKSTAKPSIGSMIIVSNDRTGDMVSAALLGKNAWAVYGTMKPIETMSFIELEDLFTDIFNEATKDNQVHFFDAAQLLEIQ